MIPTHYERIGGEPQVRALCRRFYQIMHELPMAQDIRRMHPENLQNSEDKLFQFLSGWMGGPQLYTQQYGHPMLRQRHLSFSIGDAERDQWMTCMAQALHEVVEDEALRQELEGAFIKLANHMRNSAHGRS
jgi:hemoglobin